MANLNTRTINELVTKTAEFVREIKFISNVIEDRDIYRLRYRLALCTNHLVDTLENGLESSERINKIRSYIKINSSLEECKSYLALIDQLRYYQTDYAQSELEKINREIRENYQISIN